MNLQMDLQVALNENRSGMLRIWDPPIESLEYVIGADVAEGKIRDIGMTRFRPGSQVLRSGRPDYTAACVLEKESGLHVATWHGYLDATEFSTSLAALGAHYNYAMLVPEINGPGLVVVENLAKVFEYPTIYRSKIWNKAEVDSILGADLGWRTTKVTRPLLIARIEEVVNSSLLFTRDPKLVKELRTMQYDQQGVARAIGKDKDDIVFALALALQGRYEILYGTAAREKEDPLARLSPEDRAIWRRVKEIQEETADARKRRGGGVPGTSVGPRIPRCW